MKIVKVCWYKGRHYNLTPAFVALPTEEGLILQLKFWNRHFGIELSPSVNVSEVTD
jgi:hypothetical protein